METINARLASLPDLLGYDSPAALAKACGIDPNTLRKAMQGPSNPSFDVLKALTTKNPKLSADWLLHGTGSPLRDAPARTLTPIPAQQPDYTSGISTVNTVVETLLRDRLADKQVIIDMLTAEVAELRGKPFDSSETAGELPTDPNDPRFSAGVAPMPMLRPQVPGFRRKQEAAELS